MVREKTRMRKYKRRPIPEWECSEEGETDIRLMKDAIDNLLDVVNECGAGADSRVLEVRLMIKNRVTGWK